MPKSISRTSDYHDASDEVMILFFLASFMNLAFSPPDSLQFQSDASFIGGRWRPLILQGRWSW